MPLFNRKKFQPLEIPEDVKLETDVFYLPTTNEVFTDYDAYFERIVHLNSSVWTCSITSKPGLTFDEARESEEYALKQIDEFPAVLERVILFTIHRYCGRTRLEDLVNDMFIFLKDRFFVDEEVQLKKKNRRVRILKVTYTEASTSQGAGNTAGKSNSDEKLKTPQLKLPAAQNYRYRVRVIDKSDSPTSSSGNANGTSNGKKSNGVSGIYDDIKFSEITRERHIVTKIMLKLIIKYYTETGSLKLDVKKQHIDDLMLDSISWENISDGPAPVFPQTLRAGPMKSNKEKEKKPAPQPSSSKKYEVKKYEDEDVMEVDEEKPLPAKSSTSTESSKKAKLMKKMIQQQQEELAPLIATAEKSGVENIGRWRQDATVLTEQDIQNLKDEIKDAKELERKRVIEKRRKEREELLEWKKPRDDLLCDDLKPLPKYEEFVLPNWIPKELYGDLLAMHNFFYSYSELITGSQKCPITFNAVATAVLSRECENPSLVELFKLLFSIRTECADEDDGDEANVDNAEEIGYVQNCDMDHKVYGNLIREKSRRHESLRNTFGSSVRHLPITSMTLTEVIRLTLETSGYYASGNLKIRQQARGFIKCYDDEAFQFTIAHPEIMEKLRISSIYELSPTERLAIINVIIQQLLSYNKFRDLIDERINSVCELRRDLRLLREFDRTQERESREVHAAKEAEAKAGNTNGVEKKSSKVMQKLRNYLKYLNEGSSNRSFNDADAKQTMLESVPYEDMDLHEVEEFRELQRGIIREKQHSYLQKIFALQARMGQHLLGKDRAFRAYYFVHYFNMLIIEEPFFEDIEYSCCEPTPLGHDFEAKSSAEEDAERIERLCCTGKSSNCPVHNSAICSSKQFRRWSYFVEENGLDRLLEALNPRGFREMELAENILFLKEIYEEKMSKLVEKSNKPEFLRRHFELSVDLDDSEEYLTDEDAVEMAMRARFRQMLLDTEEKLHMKDIGTVECKNDNREEWRRALEEDGDTTHLCPNDELTMYNGGPLLLDSQELEIIPSVKKLAVAFLQVVNGVGIDCILDPFAGENKKTKDLLPSKLFLSWQRELLNSESVSQLALFLTTFSKSIRWKTVTRCGTCRKNIESKTKRVIQCQECTKFFHIACTNLDARKASNQKFLRSWQCANCADEEEEEEEKKSDTEEETADASNGAVSDEDTHTSKMNGGSSSMEVNGAKEDEEEEELSSSSLDDNDDDYELERQNKRTTRASTRNEQKASSSGTKSRPLKDSNCASSSHGDAKKNFKSVLVNGHEVDEDGFGGRKRRAAAKRFIDYVYSDDRSATEESGSESPANFSKSRKVGERSLRPKKSPSGFKSSGDSFSYRHVSMGLRESDDQRRTQLKRCEALIRDAMVKPFGDAFAFPVDAKYVPHYYDVIKHPMDLRTMINKLKNFQYDAPEDLWADCRLMFDNCAEFNDEGTSILQDANELEQFLRPRFQEIVGHPLD